MTGAKLKLYQHPQNSFTPLELISHTTESGFVKNLDIKKKTSIERKAPSLPFVIE